MADRQMAHRIAAVRLEAEALGDLTGQEIAHHIFAAGRDRDVARLERRQPVGVDMGEHAGGGAELQQRDILALGDRAGELRLHLDDVGLGEPADQVDVVHGKIDDDADIRHPRRKRPDAGDRDGKNVLARDRLLDRRDRRVEALDMSDHQRHAGAARGSDDLAPLLERWRRSASRPGYGCCARCRRARPRDADGSAPRWSRHRRLRRAVHRGFRMRGSRRTRWRARGAPAADRRFRPA